MFVSGGQFYVFVATIAFGGACGIFFSLSSLLKLKIKSDLLRIFPDFFSFLIVAILYVFYAKWMSFPNFRAYMPLGVIVGITIYFKSFHILLAKCVKNLYNKRIRLLIKVKEFFDKRNKRDNERIKG